MIFTRIRMWGNLSNLGQWGKNPCVTFLCLPNHLHWRMTAGGWGSYGLWEWGGRTVSPHPHAHSTSKKHSRTLSTARYLHSLFHPHNCSSTRRHSTLHDSVGKLVHSNPRPLHCLFLHAQVGSYSSSRRYHCLLVTFTRRSPPISCSVWKSVFFKRSSLSETMP